jgi:putative transposase
MRKKGSAEEWELRRNIAANMLEQGHKPKVVAAAVGVAAQTVRQWDRVRLAGGRAALRSRKPPGRKSRLTDEQRAKVRQLLLKSPEELGFAGRYFWTQQLIADLIAREFGVTYHHDRIGRILKRIGVTHQKPARRAKERDEQKIQHWRAEVWPDLLKKVPSAAG